MKQQRKKATTKRPVAFTERRQRSLLMLCYGREVSRGEIAYLMRQLIDFSIGAGKDV